jgi:hypothetical protein
MRLRSVRASIPWSVVMLGIGAALGACASAPASNQPPSDSFEPVHLAVPQSGRIDATLRVERLESSHTVSASPERAWAAVRESYTALGIAVERADSATHSIRSPQLRVRGTFARRPLARLIDCGSGALGPFANSYDVMIQVQTRVEALNGSEAAIRSVVTATGAQTGTGSGRVTCPSTGALEQQIAEQVTQQLK